MRYALLGSENNGLFNRFREWVPDAPVAVITSEVSADTIAAADVDFGLSLGYRHILKADQIAAFNGCLNLHTGYLPWNRGAYPNVWPLIDGTPAGVTLHYMDEGIDTGPIAFRRPVRVEKWDTAETLYYRLEQTAFELLTDVWPHIKRQAIAGIPQNKDVGTTHYMRELEAINADVPGFREVVNRLRARTFAGHQGIVCDGVEVKVSLAQAYKGKQ